MLDFSRFEFLTFDCYGTLVDWETGMLGALRPMFARHGVPAITRTSKPRAPD